MEPKKTNLKFLLVAMALLLSVIPMHLNAIQATDTQSSTVKSKRVDSLQSLRLEKVFQNNLKQSINGDVAQVVKNLTQNIMNKGVSFALATLSGQKIDESKLSSMAQHQQGISGDGLSLASINKIQKDKLGFQHVRIGQTYKELPVIGAEIIVHINNNENIYMINGAYQSGLDIDIKPTVTAREALATGLTQQDSILDTRISQEASLVIYNSKLAWFFILEENGQNPAQWYYYVDAKTGKTLNYYNNIQHAAPTQGSGASAAVTGNRLTGEDGSVVTIQGFKETSLSNNYFLYSFNNLWGIYNIDENDWDNQSNSSWGPSDPAAVSCAHNFEDTLAYVSNVLNKNGFDDNGAFGRANVHEGTNLVNAYWDGTDFHFGDGDGSNSNALTVLDVAAHEYGHAITNHTSNLIYQNESGALNEAYSDILGASVEFYTQSDGTGTYPNANAGQSDWLMGEDAWVSDTALRDLKDPQRFGQPSYYLGTSWHTGSDDNGGVHTNSGVANFAYYLLSVGGSGSNDGHAYNIVGLGEAQAAKVALRANYIYHTSSSTYTDARTAWIQAATDLGYNSQTVADVWTACGVIEVEPCETTYAMEDTVTYNFEDISESGTNLNLGDDQSTEVSLPFNFAFYCNSHNSVNVSSNGTLSFTSTSIDLSNECIPSDDFEDLIAVLWDDLNPSSGGAVYTEIKGTAPNRRLIVQWEDVPRFGQSGDTTLQVILYEGSNNILYQYQDVDFGNTNYDFGASATVGIQADRTTGLEYSCDTASLSNGLAILFSYDGTPPEEEPVLVADFNSPSSSPMSLAYDSARNGVWQASENGSIYLIDAVSHTTVRTISLVGKVPSSDGNTNGIEVLSNGNLLIADYRGDVDTINDYIFEFNPDTETVVNYWPLAGTLNTSTDGSSITDVYGISKGSNGHLYLTSTSDNTIYEIAVTNGNPGTWSTTSVTTAAVVSNAMGVDVRNSTNSASDFDSTTIGIWNNSLDLLSRFSYEHSGNTYNSGVTFIPGNPDQIWVSDFDTNKIGVFNMPTKKVVDMTAIYFLLFN